jgi:hypothetical protein
MGTTIRMMDGDIYLNSAGRGEVLEGPSKCAQDKAEILMTPLDSSRDYGSELAGLEIPEPVNLFVGKAIISRKVHEAIERLKRLQELDPYAGDDERIDTIDKLVVERFNSTDYMFWVSTILMDRSAKTENNLSVSLRHQESAAYAETIQEVARRTFGGEL